jgi:hypothetical protein
MTKQEKINENFSLSYNSREDGTGDTVIDVSINFDNPKSDSVIVNRLNTWLQAIGRNDLVVAYKEHTLGS